MTLIEKCAEREEERHNLRVELSHQDQALLQSLEEDMKRANLSFDFMTAVMCIKKLRGQ